MSMITTIVIIVGVLSLLTVGFFVWMSKASWKYTFVLETPQGSKIVKAKKTVSKSNKSQKFFIFKDNSTKLHIKEPNSYHDGKPVRRIAYGPTGDYVYIKEKIIDKEYYLKHSLEAEERELALWRFNENQKNYGQVDKMQLASLFTNIALVVIIAVAVIYSVISFTNNANTFAEIAKNNRETVSEMKGQINAIERISEHQMLIMQSLNSEDTIDGIVRTIN